TRNDPRILDMARKVVLSPEPRQVELRYQVHGNEPVGPIQYAPTTITLRTDGGVFSGTSDTATGDPWDPVRRLSSVDLLRKLEYCASSVIGVRNSSRVRDYLVNIHKGNLKRIFHV